ncbi:Uncharacterised protein [Mycobacteroides abscessus subsp. abscessus]|nr:Uncharacterised protein [Mycobacteroides abscessus subsp. abscessus]
MSSSPSISEASLIARAASSEIRGRFAGSASHVETLRGMSSCSARSTTTAGVMKFSSMNSPSWSPISSFFFLIRAVCGTGMPSGCLNRAVTANQSASPPTMPASDAART